MTSTESFSRGTGRGVRLGESGTGLHSVLGKWGTLRRPDSRERPLPPLNFGRTEAWKTGGGGMAGVLV